MNLGRVTKKGNHKWSAGTVLGILQNERHCGDVLARKTFTPNYLNHKAVKNRGEKPQYRQLDHHQGIITRDDFITVQQMISFGLRGRTGMLPKLHVIENGALKGFVIINPRWTGFSCDDYINAVNTLLPEYQEQIKEAKPVTAEAGSVDLRGFVVVRSQFFDIGRTATVTMTKDTISFSAGCLPKMNNARNVEFLLDPIRKLFVIRPSTKDNRNAIGWIYFDGQKHHPRKVKGYAYLPIIFGLMGWNDSWPYYAQGEIHGTSESSFILFDLKDAEAVIRQRNRKIPVTEEQANAATPEVYIETLHACRKNGSTALEQTTTKTEKRSISVLFLPSFGTRRMQVLW